MAASVIDASGLAKKFSRSLRHTMWHGAGDLARAFVGWRGDSATLRRGEFWAVREVDFSVAPGEAFALIGANGAGKSTLMKLLNGVYLPDQGQVRLRGRVGALLELGAGFHPLLSGRENIFVNGALLGMSEAEMRRKLDAIITFADLGEFIDAPVKHYSSGMFLRLGFAIAMHLEPDVLLVDEILAVGDAAFQLRCMDRINELRRAGTALVFVSHSVNAIERLCERCLVLADGRPIFSGPTREGMQVYFEHAGQHAATAAPPAAVSRGQQTQQGLGSVELLHVRAHAAGQRPPEADGEIASIPFGHDITISFAYAFAEPPTAPTQVRVAIRTLEGRDVQRFAFQNRPLATDTTYTNEKLLLLPQRGEVRLTVREPRLFPQAFRVDVAMVDLERSMHWGALPNAASFVIVRPSDSPHYFERGGGSLTEFDFDVQVEPRES